MNLTPEEEALAVALSKLEGEKRVDVVERARELALKRDAGK